MADHHVDRIRVYAQQCVQLRITNVRSAFFTSSNHADSELMKMILFAFVCGCQRAKALFGNLAKNGVTRHTAILGSRLGDRGLSPSGDPCMVAPPVPIPNTEVKRHSSDGSACLACARVGRCQSLCPVTGKPVSGHLFFGAPGVATLERRWRSFSPSLQPSARLWLCRRGLQERLFRNSQSGFNFFSAGRTNKPSLRMSFPSNQTSPPPYSLRWILTKSQWMRLLLPFPAIS